MKLSLLVIAAMLLLQPGNILRAQDLPDVAQGLQPYVAFHGGMLDQINTQNGGLTIRIPLVSYPQLGSLSLSYSVYLNSFGFEDIVTCDAAFDPTGSIADIPMNNNCHDSVQIMPTGVPGGSSIGPRIITDQTVSAGGNSAPDPSAFGQDHPPIDGRFYVIGADNSQHPLAPSGTVYRAVDGSGYMFAPSSPPARGNGNLGVVENAYPGDIAYIMSPAPGTITDSHGIVYTANSITDPSGNSMAIGWGGFGGTDSVGRHIPGMTSGNVANCPTISQSKYPEAIFQSVTSAGQWTPPGTGSGYLFCYSTVNIHTHVTVSGKGEYIRSVPMLQSIVLPNGTYWAFVYDSADPSEPRSPTPMTARNTTGNLLRLIYPTGGSIVYSYGAPNITCDFARVSGGQQTGEIFARPVAVSTRAMVDPSGNTLGTWTYTPAIQNNGSVTGQILSPFGELTVTKFTDDQSNLGCGYLDAGVDVYSGSTTSSKLLKSTTVSYTYPNTSAYNYGGVPYASYAREISTDTSVDGAFVSDIGKTFGATTTVQDIECDYQGSNCGFGAPYSIPIGGPTSTAEVDSTTNTSRTESITYQWQAHSQYFTWNLLDIPAVTQVSGSSTQSQMNYTYDETQYSPGGTRGLPTTITHWLNTGTSPVTHVTWNNQGEKTSSIDANGTTTTFAYSTSPITTAAGQSTTVSCNGSMITSTTNPLGQTVSGTYDCDKGLLSSFTDANQQTTSVYYDGMHRIQSVTYPSIVIWNGQNVQPQTSFNYEDSADTVVESIAAAPDPTRTTTVVFDGFGGEVHRSTSSLSGPINVDTTYDLERRVHSVSNPYITMNDDSYGLTIFGYDAINRKTSQTQPDGSPLTWTYAGDLVDSSDELHRHTQRTTDSLGRLLKVVEPDPGTGNPALETDYSYDALGNLWNVTQWGGASGSSGARVRTFTYNSLSQLLCASNPESAAAQCPTTASSSYTSGTLGYTYDANGNVLTKTDARGVTIRYSYDNLNRVLSKSYSGDSTGTPWTCLQYDSSTISNGIGRLANEWTQSGSCNLSGSNLQFIKSIQGYDAMGHITGERLCTPGSCTTTSGPALTYGYDQAGSLGQFTNSVGFPGQNTLQFTYDAGAHLNTLVNQNSSYQPNIYTLQNYGAAGPLNWVLGSNLSFSQDFNSKRMWVTSITVQGQTP